MPDPLNNLLSKFPGPVGAGGCGTPKTLPYLVQQTGWFGPGGQTTGQILTDR
jgi:hypothetical protein